MKTSGKLIRVLVVDDSSFMRKLISDLLDANPVFDVIGRARNGSEAVEKTESLKPDVVTLDIEMPIMDGLEALKIIGEKFSTPVVMVSSLTKDGAAETLKALEMGAVDFIEKPSTSFIINGKQFRDELYLKLKAASEANIRPFLDKKTESVHTSKTVKPVIKKPVIPSFKGHLGVVAIAVSTGGPKALQSVVPRFPSDFPLPVLIVQHMPPGFTKSLADRLNQTSNIYVKEAKDGEQIQPGSAYIAPGDHHMEVDISSGVQRIRLHQESPVNGHRPSADPMFRSLIKANYDAALCVIMTGMGSDGTNGLTDLKKQLQTIIFAQDESSCVVFGMPKSAILSGIVDEVIPLDKITQSIVNKTGGLQIGN